jgi:hypothetical protein
MAQPPDALLAAVREQAEARVRMDVQGYARYLTPEAIDSLRASFPGLPPRVAALEIEKHEPRGADFIFDVRYSARAQSFVVRSRWRELSEGWRVVHAERLWAEGERRPGLLARLLASLLRPLARRRR